MRSSPVILVLFAVLLLGLGISGGFFIPQLWDEARASFVAGSEGHGVLPSGVSPQGNAPQTVTPITPPKDPVSSTTPPAPARTQDLTSPSTTTAPAHGSVVGLSGGLPAKTGTLVPAPANILSRITEGTVTEVEIITGTNNERTSGGLRSLSENTTLAKAARIKALDMATRHYFAHDDPDGRTPGELVTATGYQFRVTGENLAMGEFRNSAEVVTGWMNSPGHRANILNGEYTEIGVGIATGVMDGREVWFVVQEFGRPLPNCSAPSLAAKKAIEDLQTRISSLVAQMTPLKAAIDANPSDSASVDSYNALVAAYNPLVDELGSRISSYNADANAYNICIKG